MARHSKWHQIRLKKGALDKKRGKIFTQHARLIAMAARNGGDPDLNSTLRAAVENAKAANVPNDNIERAIKKGTGEGKGAAEFHEVIYEGYAPGGVALLIEALTENKNRTAQFIRSTLEKHGGHLGTPGSTAFLFKKHGVIRVQKTDETELAAIDAGAEDIEADGDVLLIYADPTQVNIVRSKLISAGCTVLDSEIGYYPSSQVAIDDAHKADSLSKMIEALEDNDDVTNVWLNLI